MNKRTLGNTGESVTEIGLGCWQLGKEWGKDMSQDAAFEILQKAIDKGVRFFDTADVYGGGQSEKFVGAFFNKNPEDVFIATKFGRGESVYPDKYSEEALRKSVQESAERLQVPSLDLLQLHCIPKEELQKGEIFDWLRKAKKDGLIKHFGASVETVEEGMICLKEEGITSLQVIVNIFRQKPTKELFEQARKKNVGIIVRLPLASGLLTGKFNKDTTFPESDHRNFNKDGEAFNVGETFAGLPFKKGVELANEIETSIKPAQLTLAELSLRWLLDHEAVTTIIPGASSPNHIAENAAVSEKDRLSDKTHELLENFYEKEVKNHIRGPY